MDNVKWVFIALVVVWFVLRFQSREPSSPQTIRPGRMATVSFKGMGRGSYESRLHAILAVVGGDLLRPKPIAGKTTIIVGVCSINTAPWQISAALKPNWRWMWKIIGAIFNRPQAFSVTDVATSVFKSKIFRPGFWNRKASRPSYNAGFSEAEIIKFNKRWDRKFV